MSNHLALENSFYLQKHQKNPINWYPWGEDAFQKAKQENKSIFLSIGYSSSLWCKTMEEESFKNENIAELLNERFISIKVDKEEHPEVSKYYQKVYKLMNRSESASPLSIFLTQNLEPFYASGYIAPEAQEEHLGFEALLRVISKKYITDYETLAQKGQEVLAFVNPKEQKIEATKLDFNIVNTIELHTDNLLDKKNGGFGNSPKFPNASIFELLLDTYQLTQKEALLEATRFSLEKISLSNLYDKENGGFYNYSKDATWKEVNKVKTSHDNAQLIQIYLRLSQITDSNNYQSMVIKSLDFMLKEMLQDGLFLNKIYKENILDTTVLCSHNAMMVSTLFMASGIDKKYQKIAINVLDSLLNKFYIHNQLHHSTLIENTPSTKGFLEDYAYLGESLIHAYQVTLDESYLIKATDISNTIIEKFYKHGQWEFSLESLKIKENIHDTEYPSSISSALSLLLSISSLVDSNYKKFVFKTLEINSYNLMRQPLSSPKLTQALLRYLKNDIVIKSNENILEKEIDKKALLGYPYILFKTTLDENILLSKADACFAKETSFENIKLLIESHT